MYPMSDQDRAVQARARAFVDEELIPHEVEAELHGGRLPELILGVSEQRSATSTSRP